MKQSVEARLAGDSQLSQVQVLANAGQNEVTLSGPVPSEEAHHEAIVLTKAVVPMPIIVDEIEVKPTHATTTPGNAAEQARQTAKELGDKIGASIDDAWVYTKIEAKLVKNTAAPAFKINVDVQDNVVTLRGDVQTAAMREQAERIARETEGVRAVRNLLQVRA
jgi:osmotically-inducible protein OsmY